MPCIAEYAVALLAAEALTLNTAEAVAVKLAALVLNGTELIKIVSAVFV